MEQYRQIGEALGSLKALMVFADNIHVNKRQCCLLLDVLTSAYEMISEEMKHNLKFEEKNLKWKILEHPLKELHRVFKEAEGYVKHCLETKDWWAKMILLYHNTDCVEFYIHNLLTCIPVVIEAIEIAGEFSGQDQDKIQKKRFVYADKYQKQWKDPELFQWKFGKQYLVTPEFCYRYATVSKEDGWILLNKLCEKSVSGSTKHERQLADLLLKNLQGLEGALNGKLLPSSILIGSKDYHVRRRLGNGSQYKEIQWLGESFALRHFFGEIESQIPEISMLLSLAHPNILQLLCGFIDEEKKECFLVMELMSKALYSYIKETCGPRKRIPFTLHVAVDVMLQIARGMEYLHSKKIYHGNLSTSKILVKHRTSCAEGYLLAKVSGFGLSSIKNSTLKTPSNQNEILPFIWCAPEVLEEQEHTGNSSSNSKYTEKADVYSFGMVCFELLTGKVPFEDSHLQGDKTSRNIRAGERPLFPFFLPKYITNLTKKCWHADPSQRPNFSSICRILRYTKRFFLMNPDYNRELEAPTPSMDYSEMETKLAQKFPSWEEIESSSVVPQIPFQMFMYRVVEKEKIRAIKKEISDSGSDKASMSGDENVTTPIIEDPLPLPIERKLSSSSLEPTNKRHSSLKRLSSDSRAIKLPGTPKGLVRGGSCRETRSARPPQLSPSGRNMRSLRLSSETHLHLMSPRIRRSTSGHASDSEIP